MQTATSKKRSTVRPDAVIQLLTKKNPKRPGSRAYAKFDILLKMNGKTVREYKSKEGQFNKLDKENGWPAKEIRYSKKFGLIKLITKH